MNRAYQTIAAVGLAAATLASPAIADEFLTVGDKAPDIDITHWLKGEQIEEFEEGNIYVVEFWATWCGPCRASMPHITKLQEEMADYDVTFLGVSDENLQTVVEWFLKEDKDGTQWYNVMGYTVATDPDRSVYNDYMKAAGHGGIPTAFVVGRQGDIEWIGHPMMIDEPLNAIARDTWDRESFKTEYEKQQAAQREATKARRALGEAIESGDFEKAMALMEKQLEEQPENLGLQLQMFRMMVADMDMPTKGYAFGQEFITNNNDNAMLLNAIAWTVVDDKGIKTRNYEFALKAAKRANELTEGKDPAILDTLARVHYEMGDLAKAVEIQSTAVKYAEGTDWETDLKKALKKYKEEAK